MIIVVFTGFVCVCRNSHSITHIFSSFWFALRRYHVIACIYCNITDYHTAERSQIVTFPQPYSTAYITTFKMTDTGAYSSIEEANAGGGSVCIRAGTATIDSLTPITNSVVECADNADCIAKLKAGECDLWATDNQNGGGAIGDEPDISATGEVLLDIFWLTNALKR